MRRRNFIAMMGGLPIQALNGMHAFGRPEEASETIVNTPGQRRIYSWQLLNKLCTNIGPRPTGTSGFARGAQIIKTEMERSLPSVFFDPYKFKKWELVGEPEFIMGRQYIESCPTFGGRGTPPEGITGTLKKRGSEFVLVDTQTGSTQAEIITNQYGKAITHYQRPDSSSLPSFGIGKQDVSLVENAVANKTPTHVKAWTRYISQAPGKNIIGQVPGKKKDEILFIAHADTVYNSPGANDNTASVIVMLMLGHAFASNNLNHTLTFMAADGEEYGQLGAKHYAQQRIAEDTMENIRYVVNFDSLTYGPNLWISSKQREIKDMICSINKDLNINITPKFDRSDGFVMDSAPFRSSRAAAMHINSRGYNEKTLPVYHRPNDVARNVPLDCMEIGYLVFEEFIKRVDNISDR